MTIVSMGDLARNWVLRSNASRMTQKMTVLKQELVTGRVADPARRLAGDMSAMASLKQTAASAESHRANASFATLLLDAQQNALERITTSAQARMLELIRPELITTDDRLPGAIQRAGQALDDAIRHLNTSVAGRSVFAGAATDQPALISRDALMDTLKALIPPGADAVAVDQIIADWFNDPGGFSVAGYRGGPAVSANLPIGAGQDIRLSLTASDPTLRDLLASLSKAAILAEEGVTMSPDQQRFLLRQAGQGLQNTLPGLLEMQARVGVDQERAETGRAQAEAAHLGASMSLERLLSVDQFETGSALQQALADMEKLYILTARLSRLSLSEYLR